MKLRHNRETNHMSRRRDNLDRRRRPVVCGSRLELRPSLRRRIEAFPEAGGPAPRRLSCCLPAGHHGWHLGEGVESWRREAARWVRWQNSQRDIFDADKCDRPRDQASSTRHDVAQGEPDHCHFPVGHPGGHSFSYVPDRAWPRSRVTIVADANACHRGDSP